MWALRDKACIVGVGETEYTRRGGIARSEFQLACEAVLRAVADAGLELDDVDGLVTYSSDRNQPSHVAQVLGIPVLRFADLYPGGGNAACGVVHHAAMAVFSGTADMVVCYRALAQGQFFRLGKALVQDRKPRASSHYGSVWNRFRRAAICIAGATAHARVRHDQRAVRGDRARELRARATQPARNHAEESRSRSDNISNRV